MTHNPPEWIATARYLSLETYRKAGTAVRTPVWFAERDGVLYVYTGPDSGKVKRIRNHPSVRIAPCNMRGDVKGEWIGATASIEGDSGARLGHTLLSKKYIAKRFSDFYGRLVNRKSTVLSIRIQRD